MTELSQTVDRQRLAVGITGASGVVYGLQMLDALRERIDAAYAQNAPFKAAAQKFLETCKETINPTLTEADVREMLIQHILTEEIFTQVFNEGDFHHENNIARELYALEGKFFTGAVKKETLKGLEPYYAAIRANAAQITSHAEKQTFLKVIYENFYKVYDTKKADRLGVVYTPNEIVKFMIEGADWLCEKHFGKNLIDPHVEILDPATGTGTFICELLDYFRGDPKKLAHKYKNELHANEVAILPYYVANLNIEATYAAISGQFAEFPNLCFVDTLDNVEGLGIRAGHQHDMFAALSDENIERVKRQNARKISVIIGNPPYNANQQNENDNNKNREYPQIDQRIAALAAAGAVAAVVFGAIQVFGDPSAAGPRGVLELAPGNADASAPHISFADATDPEAEVGDMPIYNLDELPQTGQYGEVDSNGQLRVAVVETPEAAASRQAVPPLPRAPFTGMTERGPSGLLPIIAANPSPSAMRPTPQRV